MKDNVARRIGWSLIGLLWLLAAYLITHYVAIWLIGPERLHQALGDRLYNAIVPMGGFPLLLLVIITVVVWAVPFGLTFGAASLLLRASLNLSLRRRTWAAAVVAGCLTLALPSLLLDGWPWALVPVVWEDDTEFATGYSALGFWLVRAGMNENEVVARVGVPLERYPVPERNGEGWRWTRSQHDGSYRVRVVIFRTGRVVEKHSAFYID